MGTFTTNDYQTKLAYRLGETAAPNDSTTKNLRLSFGNEAYMTIARRRNWSWLEASHSSNTNTGVGDTTGYAEPTDLKEFIEMKIGGIFYDQIPYKKNRDGSVALVTLPAIRSSREFYRFGGRYYFVTNDANDAEPHLIKYWKRVTDVADGGTFLIPDEYFEALVAYGEAKVWLSYTQQLKAAAPFAQFEEIVGEMEREESRRGWGQAKMNMIMEPEEAYY